MGVERTWFLGGGQADIGFDAVIREHHLSRLTVTKNPVETGVPIADHFYIEPKELEIEIRVSDFWLHGRDQFGVAVKDRYSSQQGQDALFVRGSTGETSRSATALAILYDLQESGAIFFVQTGLRGYENMILEEVDAEQAVRNASTLSARLKLSEVIRSSTRTVVYPPRKAGKTHRQASKKVEGGDKKTEAVTEREKSKTILKNLLSDPTAAIKSFLPVP